MAKSIVKNLLQRIKSKGGRSNGMIMAPRRGNYAKKIYRFVDFKREIYPGVQAIVVRNNIIDPNRNSLLSLLAYPSGCLTYIVSTDSIRLGQKVVNFSLKEKFGDSKLLNKIASGSLIFNLTVANKLPGQYVRAAGNSAILVKNNHGLSLIKFKSGEYRYFYGNTLAVLGKVNNSEYFLKEFRLAGKSRRLGIRPRNRPLARNPVDHPMGGRTKGGTPKLTPKGKISLNTETKKNKNKLVIIKAREKKKI